MIYSYFSHPHSVCMSYYEHFKFSMKVSKKLFIGSIKAFIHAIFPNLFKASSNDLIEEFEKEFGSVGCIKKKNGIQFPHNLYPTDVNRALKKDE